AAADDRTLFDRSAGFVLDLDRHRLTVKLGAVDERAVIPDAGNGPHEEEPSLDLLGVEVHAALLPVAHEGESGVAVADNDRNLNASFEDVAMTQVIEGSAGRANLVLHVHLARGGAERRQGRSRVRRSRGRTQADLGSIEGPMERGELHLVDGDREIPNG